MIQRDELEEVRFLYRQRYNKCLEMYRKTGDQEIKGRMLECSYILIHILGLDNEQIFESFEKIRAEYQQRYMKFFEEYNKTNNEYGKGHLDECFYFLIDKLGLTEQEVKELERNCGSLTNTDSMAEDHTEDGGSHFHGGKNLQEMQDFIQNRVSQCQQCSVQWEEKIESLAECIKNTKSSKEIERLKFQRQQCIGTKNELLAVADFGNELLQNYFGRKEEA